jgi:glycerophosphoryl diester phosphodiesterase
LVAHRGVYQNFDRAGVGNDTCTATRIRPPVHGLIENSLASIEAAFAARADIVEIDVAPTRDGRIVLFHDWTLECRTDGTGPVRDRTLAELKALDIGHGYTADGGKTFPLRGKGVGRMPTLEEVLVRHPRRQFMINFKSNEPREADLVAAAFARAGRPIDAKYSFYGGAAPVARMRAIAPAAWGWSKDRVQACLKDYVATGWTGFVPASCSGGTVAVPLNYQWLVWGWPKRFMQRMDDAGVKVILTGPYERGSALAGIERLDQIPQVPRDFTGYLWVEDIATIGPALRN